MGVLFQFKLHGTEQKRHHFFDRYCSCLANCRLVYVHVSVHCCLVLYGLSKERVFVPVHVPSVLTGTHRDSLIVASFGQEPEIQSLVSQGQIMSADLL